MRTVGLCYAKELVAGDIPRTIVDVLDDPSLAGGIRNNRRARWTPTSEASTATMHFLRITFGGLATARASSVSVTFWRHWMSMHPLFSQGCEASVSSGIGLWTPVCP